MFTLPAAGQATAATDAKTLAADVTGTWKSEFDSQIGHQKYTFTLKQDGAKLTGKANSEVEDRKRKPNLRKARPTATPFRLSRCSTSRARTLPSNTPASCRPTATRSSSRAEVGDLAKYEIVAKREQADSAAKSIRIKAGSSESVKDAEGNVWQAEKGFEGGQTIARPTIQIANTKSPELYRAEHYSMNSFTWPVPNGKYLVKLHFAETYEGITGPGQRVLSFKVQGTEFKDFDPWVKAGKF